MQPLETGVILLLCDMEGQISAFIRSTRLLLQNCKMGSVSYPFCILHSTVLFFATSPSLYLLQKKLGRKCDVWQCLPSSNRQQGAQTFLAQTASAFHKGSRITDQTSRFGKLPVNLPKVMSEDTCKALFVPAQIESSNKIVSPMLCSSLEAISPLPPSNPYVYER